MAIFMYFNGSTAAAYQYFAIEHANTTDPSQIVSTASSAMFIGYSPSSLSLAGSFSQFELKIFNYHSTFVKKTFAGNSVVMRSSVVSTARIAETQGLWNSTAAITQINIIPNSTISAFSSGSWVALYGVT